MKCWSNIWRRKLSLKVETWMEFVILKFLYWDKQAKLYQNAFEKHFFALKNVVKNSFKGMDKVYS